MSRLSVFTIFALFGGGILPSLASAATYQIDPFHTFPHFKINHLGFSTMHGRFNQTTGTINLDLEKKTGSIDVVIDASSVDTGMKKRDDHLRSPDFLNAVEFPEIRYKSSQIKFNGDSSATVEGTLTIMGVNKPTSLDVTHIHCGLHPMDPKKLKYVCGFDAASTIKRSDFGITYGLGGIGDEMDLEFEVEAIRQ